MVSTDQSIRPGLRGSAQIRSGGPRAWRAGSTSADARVLGYLSPGLPYFAPLGELIYDPVEDLVQCHLCGGWFRLVAGPHLSRVHGWTASAYRETFRLLNTEALCARGLSDRQRANGARRVGSGETPVGARVTIDQRRTMFAERRFPRWRSFGVRHPELLEELHPTRNVDLDPFAVAAGSHRRLWWRCRRGHEWLAAVYNRAAGTGCPRCAGEDRTRIRERRTLADIDPAVLAQLHPTLNENLEPARIGALSHRKVWWRCPQGHEWRAEIQSRTRGAGCPRCHRGIRPPTRDVAKG